MYKHSSVLFLVLLFFCSVLPISSSQPEQENNGSITFQPNVIPELTLTPQTGRNNESFRFEWLGNTFDIELFFNATYEKKGENITKLFSLHDFEDDFEVSVDYVVNKTDRVQFGWVIDNVEDVSDFVHNAWFKIEDSSFDYKEIEIEELELYEGYNVTRYYLPDNMELSFEDLEDKGFVIGHQNKTATSIEGFSGKSSWDLDPVVFGAPTITITGYTSAVPCTFLDVWNADQAGGWGVFKRTVGGKIQYNSDAEFDIGDGSTETHFSDNNTQLIFTNISASANGRWFLDVKAKAYFTLGILVDEDNKATTGGVSVFLHDTSYAFHRLISGVSNSHIYLYDCQFINTDNVRIYSYLYGNASTYSRIWNTAFTSMDNIYLQYFDLYKWRVSGAKLGGLASYAIACRGSITVEELDLYDNSVLFFSGATFPFSIKNVYARNTTNFIMRLNSKVSAEANRPTLINVDSDVWLIHWLGGALAVDNRLYRQYEFDLTVTYPNGTAINGTDTGARATIQHYGEGATVDYNATVGTDGTIPTQTINMGFYNITGGNTIYSYNDYNLEISNITGYETYTRNFTLSEQESWEIALTPTTPTPPSVVTFNSVYYLVGLAMFLPFLLILVLKRRKNEENS